MDGQMAERFQEHFGKMQDPRVERTKLYRLQEILFVLLCGSICGAESWRDFVMFGQEKLDFLREYFPFSAGIPCKNTFARVCAALEPEQFRACFVAWAASLQRVPGEVIAIDGKTLCNSANAGAGAAAIHMVSAFATDSRLVLAQQKVAEKSNEITAIPALLDLLDVAGHTLTIDAMGCQRSIAQKIRDKGADYVLALKGNQGALNDDVRLFLECEAAKPGSLAIRDTWGEADAGHGRVESRRCIVSDRLDWLEQRSRVERLAQHRHDRRDARHQRQSQLRAALFHQHSARQRPANCHCGAYPLGYRERAARDAGRRVQRRSIAVCAKTMRRRTWPSCAMSCSTC